MDAREVAQGRLYRDLAELMALISPPEEYAEEAARWREVLRAKLGLGRHEILELGVGGGHNLSHLTGDFEATAVDISPAMLEVCQRLNPSCKLHLGDMRNVRLGLTFAAVLIHDAISYMLTEEDLAAAFATAAAHLRPGGVLIVSPDRFRETFHSPEITHAVHRYGDRLVTYFEYTFDPNPADTRVETLMVYLVEEEGRLRVEHDRHVTGIFPRATWLTLLGQAGFSVEIREFSLAGLDHPYELPGRHQAMTAGKPRHRALGRRSVPWRAGEPRAVSQRMN